jgi:hypothetical protein
MLAKRKPAALRGVHGVLDDASKAFSRSGIRCQEAAAIQFCSTANTVGIDLRTF